MACRADGQHEIPKEKGAGGRISLTFRQLPVTGAT